jgi:predicted RNase H-like nuclease
MPLALSPITRRRAADDAVSRAYGARACGTHTPSAVRPGRISDDLRLGFAAAGYPLRTTAIAAPSLIEVYPHPALVELAAAPTRLPYKAAKVGRYWPAVTPADRRARLLEEWRRIVELLEGRIEGVAAALPPPAADAPGHALKAFEDKLDAVVCAWVGGSLTEIAGLFANGRTNVYSAWAMPPS